MKRLWIIVAAFLLTGCASQKDYEVMADDYIVPEQEAKQVNVSIPKEDAAWVMPVADTGEMYFCDGYTVLVETFDAGDLDKTLKQVSGFSRDELQVVERTDDNLHRLECVWAAAGEGQDQIGRAVILDDGAYHYVLTFMADAPKAGQLMPQWEQIADSFSLDTAQ